MAKLRKKAQLPADVISKIIQNLILGPAHDNGTGDGIDNQNNKANKNEKYNDDFECARVKR